MNEPRGGRLSRSCVSKVGISRQHMHTGDGFTAFDSANGVPRDAAFPPQSIHAQALRFPQFLMPTWQPFAAALGVVEGVVVAGAVGMVAQPQS